MFGRGCLALRSVRSTAAALWEFTNVLDQILVIVAVTFLAMVSPGPDMVLVIRNTLVDGRRAGLQTSIGILLGNLVHITYCLLGIGLLIARSIIAFSVLTYAAGAYLVYLGIISIRSGQKTSHANDLAPQRPGRSCFVQGFVNSILNPKAAFFYLGVFTTVITPQTGVRATIVFVVTMMLVSASFWLFFVCTLNRPIIREFIEQSRQAVDRTFGVLLILLGVRIASMSR